MHRWLFESRLRSWGAYILVMLCLAAASIALVQQQSGNDMARVRQDVQQEATLLTGILSEVLRRGQYQNVEPTLMQWGTNSPNITMLSVVTQNGTMLGLYQRALPATDTFSSEMLIEYSYRGQATLTSVRDLSDVLEHRQQLIMQLTLIYCVLAALLALLVHFVYQRQREADLLQLQKLRLDSANNALQSEVMQRRQTEEALFEAKERAEVTLHSIGDAVITTDNQGVVTYLNPVAEHLTGWPMAEALGKPLADIFHIINEESRDPAPTPVMRCLHEGKIIGLANHTVLIARNGSERAIEDSAAPIRTRGGKIAGVVMVFHDVTQSREIAQQLSWQASHDALTGLPNRREFESRLRRALAGSHAEAEEHALLYIDLDQFKIVNDTCGHIAGDEMLRQLSGLLHRQLRASDLLARLGGDEFGVLLAHCPLDRAIKIAETLRDTTRLFRFAWDNKTFEVSASIGVIPIHKNSGTLSQLLSAADMACYVAKEKGRNRYHVYQETDADFARRHGEMLWVTRINQALRENQFVLYRQAIQSTQPPYPMHHYEVLLRIRNEDGTISEPGSFLPAAERYDLMSSIDRWVITNLFMTQGETLRAPLDAAMDDVVASINLSGASLNEDTFLDFVRDMLARHAINPRRVCFEITETVAISHLERAINFITTLRALGCRFALDDFGSGLSSFGYLKNLPVDYLKIDGSLIRNLVENPVDAAMVRAIHQIGHVMGLKTVAEYVESEPLRQFLIEMGVDYMQGFAIERPRPFAALDAEPAQNIPSASDNNLANQ